MKGTASTLREMDFKPELFMVFICVGIYVAIETVLKPQYGVDITFGMSRWYVNVKTSVSA